MNDPWSPPESEAARPRDGGRIDVATALMEGAGLVGMNLHRFIGVGLASFLVYLLSFLALCVGWIATLPLLLFGWNAFLIALVDGKAEISTLFRAFTPDRAAVSIWANMVLLFFCLALLNLPSIGTSWYFRSFAPDSPLWMAIGIPTVVSFVWMAITVRFQLASYHFVDDPSSAVEALERAARIPLEEAMKLAAVWLVPALFMLPVSSVMIWNLRLMERQGSMHMPSMVGAYVVAMPLGLWAVTGLAVAYRQLHPAPQTA